MSSEKSYYKKIKELINTKITGWETDEFKKEYLISLIIEKAHEQLSNYRQRKEDLIARMATDWPNWGCGLEFFTFFILPLLKNPLLLHFINLSDDIDLSKYTIKYGYVNDGGKINWVSTKLEIIKDTEKCNPDLVDMAIFLLSEKEDVGLKNKIRLVNSDLKTFLVRVRDVDIGVQAFFSIFEGIIRNTAKHSKSKEDFEIRIVFCENYEKLKSLFDTNFEETIKDLNDDRYSYVIISLNGDLCKERKIEDKPVIQFLNDSLNEPIIDDTGNITPGKWGMKEIKICSCFLSGETLERTNDTSINYVKVVNCPTILWDNDGKERFCYVIKLEKPRYVLAVLPEDKLPKEEIKKEWLKLGVKFVGKNNFGSTNTDFDFLYVDSSVNIDEYINQNWFKLPQRIVKDNLDFNLPSEESEKINKWKKIIKGIYLSHLKRYLDNDNWRVCIYFHDKNKQNIWNDWLRNRNFAPQIEINFPGESQFLFNNDKKNIFIYRHAKLSEAFSFDEGNTQARRLNNNWKLYYYQHASYSDLFFSFLMNINPQELGELVFWQVLESTLLNVLVIDERVAKILVDKESPDERDAKLEEKLYWMGIYVTKSVKIKGQTLNYAQCSNNSKMIEVDFDKIMNNSGNRFFAEDNIPVDILLIHATRLNEILSEYNKKSIDEKLTKEEFVEKIRKKIPYVVVHSGRGKTKGDIPSNAPFLEYSIIQKYLLQEPSKFYLIQIALNAKGGQ